MKKTLKVLLCVILTLSMALSFAACDLNGNGGGDGDTPVNKEEREKASREVLEKFLDAYSDMNTREAAKYTNADTDDDELFDGVEDVKEQAREELGDTPYNAELIDIMIDTMVNSMEYEIKDCKEDGDNYVYTVELKSVSYEQIGELFKSIENDNAMTEEVVLKAIEEGIIVGDEEVLTTEQSKAIEQLSLDYILQILREGCDDLEPEATTEEVTLIEEDGEWLIDADESEDGESADLPGANNYKGLKDILASVNN